MQHGITAQIIGLIGAAIMFASFQMKKNREFYILQGLGGLCFSLNFFMLGAFTGCILNVINVIRGGIFAAGDRYRKIYLIMIIQALYIAAAIFTYSGLLTAIILIAQLSSTFAMWTKNGKTIRLVQLFCVSPLWLAHNIVTFSLGGITCESFNIISVIISIIRFGINGFEKQTDNL